MTYSLSYNGFKMFKFQEFSQDSKDYPMTLSELEQDEEPDRLNYELWLYKCGTAECSTCGVIGDYKSLQGGEKLAFNGVGNYYCKNCKGLGPPLVEYVFFEYEDWGQTLDEEQEKEDEPMCLSELLELHSSFITIQPDETEDNDHTIGTQDEVKLRVRKNRQRKSRSQTTSVTCVTKDEVRSYADEMKTFQEKIVAAKMLVNYLPDYKNEDPEEDDSKKMYSKKTRENDIHRERAYKQYNSLM